MKEWVSINIYGDPSRPVSRRELAEAMHEVNLALDKLFREIATAKTQPQQPGDDADSLQHQKLSS